MFDVAPLGFLGLDEQIGGTLKGYVLSFSSDKRASIGLLFCNMIDAVVYFLAGCMRAE